MSQLSKPSLTLGFLSPHNPYDCRSFSGTVHFAAAALRRHPRVTLKILGDHRPPRISDRLFGRACPKIDAVSMRAFEGLDAVISVVGSTLLDPVLNHLNIPFLHVTDATPTFLRDCYKWNIPADADALEARVVKRAAAVMYSSAEIAERAAAEFGIAPYHAPFGVNLGAAQRPKTTPTKPDLRKLQLLFVGNDWDRKGGDLAVATFQTLRRLGADVHLTIVGHAPKFYGSDPDISIEGYLNKNKSDQAAKLARLYSNAHVLLVPSRADCTPMVVAEAMAFGTPALASDVGGIASLIGGAGTGRLLSPTADADRWAQEVSSLVADPFAYQTMSDACFDRANRRLTWDAWCEDVLATVDTFVSTKPGLPPTESVAA